MSPELFIIVASLMAFGAMLMAFGHVTGQVDASRRRSDWIKYAVFFAFVVAMLLALTSGPVVTSLLVLLIVAAGTRELYLNARSRIRSARITTSLLSCFVLLCLAHLVFPPADGLPTGVVFLFLVVAVTDSFSQLWGKLLGQHRLCPRISPGKTVEGLYLGIGSALVSAAILSSLLKPLPVTAALLLGMITAIAAVFGDLLFSFIKRQLAIKDFAHTLPGHGGILDRLDSLIVAAPVFYWIHKLVLTSVGGILP